MIPSSEDSYKSHVIDKVVDYTDYQADEQVIFINAKNRHKFKQPFFMFFQPDGMRCSENSKLKDFDFRMLIYLVSSCGYENYLEETSQKKLADKLKKSKAAVSRSLSRLEKENYLESRLIGSCKMYKISDALGWKGKAKNHPNYNGNRVTKR